MLERGGVCPDWTPRRDLAPMPLDQVLTHFEAIEASDNVTTLHRASPADDSDGPQAA